MNSFSGGGIGSAMQPFKFAHKILQRGHRWNASYPGQCSPMVFFFYFVKVKETLESVNDIQQCNHSNNLRYWPVLLFLLFLFFSIRIIFFFFVNKKKTVWYGKCDHSNPFINTTYDF